MTEVEPPGEPSTMHKAWTGIGEAIHARVGPKMTAARVEATTSMLEQIEADLVPLVKPIADRTLADPDTPDVLRPILEVLAGPEHFSGSIVISFAAGAVLSPALGAALAPIVQVVANNAWKLDPTAPLPPAVLVEMALKGVALTGNAQLGGVDLAAEAALSGIGDSRFAAMTQAAGQSLGVQEALLLYRRKQIPWTSADPAAPGMLQVLQYSNVNPRFYAMIQNLEYVPLSTGEVVTANLKGHLDDATAVTLLQHAGIDGAAPVAGGMNVQQLLRASAGRPPGIEQMLELRNRTNAGLTTAQVTDVEVGAAVRQSDINDDYLPFVLELGHYIPPPRSVVPLLRSGAITPEQANTLLTAYGVGEPWASAFIAEAHATKAGKVKELGQAQIVALYEARLLTAAVALPRIEALGYSPTDAQALLDLADEKRTFALQAAAARKVGAEYVGRKITLAEATNALNAAGVPTAAQHDMVTYWDVERTVSVHQPSPAQVVGAFRRSEITAAECKLRLQQLGIADTDLAIFVADGYPPGKAAQAQAEATAVVNA